ncbi:MAG: prepilin-type N-terminal cleavage/methylation domain-containing protein [Planctomycetes bacterium]|nr:prepilin-type N-terminal cleavage/methylation domain-containing protein [Planctomycetota bacterium]
MITISSKHAFTLIELLVATTIFVSLMGLATLSFSRLSKGGQKGMQVLELHSKADSILRYMESDLRAIPNISAIHLRPEIDDADPSKAFPGTFTFMRQVNDTHPNFTNKTGIVPDYNPFESKNGQKFRFTDVVWVRWQWSPGNFSRGQSRISQASETGKMQYIYQHSGLKRYTSCSRRFIREVHLNEGYPMGIQENAVAPMLQRHYDFFEGKGTTVNDIDEDGETSAIAGQKITVSQIVDGDYFSSSTGTGVHTGAGNDNSVYYSEYFDREDSPWRTRSQEFQGGDQRHHYTTLDCGNSVALKGANGYAVRNPDGKSVNKDRLNLLGSDHADDTDEYGEAIYPNQIHQLFNGVEYLEIELVKRNGKVVANVSDETNRLGDGTKSFDISGVHPQSGDGLAKRPTHVRISYLLHTINLAELDELDIDGNGDTDEPLMIAISNMVRKKSYTDQVDKVQEFKKIALREGYTAIYFCQSVQLGY